MATAASMRPPPPEGVPGDRAPSPSPPATLAYCHPDPRWLHALHDALAGRRGQSVARRLVGRYAHDLPAGYAQTTTAATAALDLIELDRVTRSDSAIVMTMRADVDAKLLRLVLYKRGPRVTLSELLPILENLGLTVVEEVVYRFEGSHDAQPLHLHDFGVHTGDTPFDVGRDGPRLTNAVEAIWAGRAAADALNRLILAAHLAWDDVAILRAYRRYRQQVDATFSAPYLDAALTDQPVVARALIDLFTARLVPERGDEAAVAVARQRVIEGCDAVERLDTDRILRGYLALVEATVRTNHWVVDDAGAPREHLALKLDSQAVPGIPRPVPFREVFVCAADMEGVHLRDGPVARGGIRWSDRPEDYRTEILGLMKAQSVKNAVIVPTGAKGGFVLTQQPADPKERRAAVQRAYITFIRGLLDVTDNVVDGEVVPPSQVRRADGDDPYLVVAADRGTATFSDLANTISAEYGFWLGDGFASGGSRGYDHKAMGITARGAWVAVQRHFRELDVGVQAQTITVVGIGDMSGDVFGNGLLRSRAAKLVAAFDHRHIFIDPDPDPTASFAERQRLYDLPHSSWDDYDRGLISAGGGVWPRAAKRVPLSAPVRALLGVQATALSPPELIRDATQNPTRATRPIGASSYADRKESSGLWHLPQV